LISKGGIVCKLNSRTSILSSVNPINYKYDPKRSILQNTNLSPALLSKFDLIFIMLDQQDEASDRKWATYILDIYSKNYKEVIKT